jgi:hypothetical protein
MAVYFHSFLTTELDGSRSFISSIQSVKIALPDSPCGLQKAYNIHVNQYNYPILITAKTLT